jgi:lysophospholipase L1-like esterase
MTQFFILGDSVAYGVGAEQAGWADLLKQWLFNRMYSEHGVGETYELFNFAYPGGGIEFVLGNQLSQLAKYRRDGSKTVAIVCTGGNNAKAIDTPENVVSSLEAYEALVVELLQSLQQNADAVIALPSLAVVDESKVSPKISPFTGKKSFINNARIAQYNSKFQEVCQTNDVTFVSTSTAGWASTCLYADGLHPNQIGHQRLFEQIKPLAEALL